MAEEALGSPVVQVVYGMESGAALVRHPAVCAVGFTGSAEGAKALQAVAAVRPDPIPFYGELGSVNPVVITRSAMARDGRAIIRGLVSSYTQSAGQYCTKPGLVFVPSGWGAEALMTNELTSVGRSPMLTRGIRERFATRAAAVTGLHEVEVIYGPDLGLDHDVAPVAVRTRIRELPDVALEECFGPLTVLVEYDNLDEVVATMGRLGGSLTTTVHMTDDDTEHLGELVKTSAAMSGRLIFGGWPTGVAVARTMQHGGPWPATTNSLHTSVGLGAARRFLRPVCFQDAPDALLPPELRDANPLGITRRVDGAEGRGAVPASSEH
jgi:NADP-dependent aldehyde dehydrogenase